MPIIKLINKTNRTLNIYDEAGEKLLLTLPPDKEPATLPMTGVALPPLNEVIPVSTTEYGAPSELPAYNANIMYIVPNLYRTHSERADVLGPGPLLRDDDGKPYGCRGLVK